MRRAFVLTHFIALLLLSTLQAAEGQEPAAIPEESGIARDPHVLQAQNMLGKNAFGNFARLLIVSGELLLVLLVSIACGVVLAYHPHHIGRSASMEEVDQPKSIITYTLIGALVGLLVSVDTQLGLVIFGIGGLMRFRTDVGPARETGRMILSTLLGILCGMQLWVAVVFVLVAAWLLILCLDWRVAYRMTVRNVETELVDASANAYRAVLEEYPFSIRQTRKNPLKKQFSVLFKASRDLDKDTLEGSFRDEIDEKLRGTVDWPEEG